MGLEVNLVLLYFPRKNKQAVHKRLMEISVQTYLNVFIGEELLRTKQLRSVRSVLINSSATRYDECCFILKKLFNLTKAKSAI